MIKQLQILLITLFSINCYSQILFEKGYYIDNSNQQIECQIKNIDWKSNPSEIEYRLSENNESIKLTISSVKEFGMYNISKYIRETVNIDRSSDDINNIDYNRNPIFKEEVLFLRVLVEGKSNLYQYADGNLTRFFYTTANSEIEQLIFKSYKISENNIAQNNRYRQQIWNNLKCQNIKTSKIESLDYKKKELVRFFKEYSKCHDNELIDFGQKVKKDLFKLSLRPRLNSTSLAIQNSSSNLRDTDFGSKIGFGFGIEAEFILPFNNNKWSVFIEPTYQYFKSQKTSDAPYLFGGLLVAEVDYNSLEIPAGVRHYFFLNKSSKFFINASFLFDLISKSSIAFNRANGTIINSLEINSRLNFALGLGYKYNDKFGLEIRYQTNREILEDYILWGSDYKTISVIFGYSVF